MNCANDGSNGRARMVGEVDQAGIWNKTNLISFRVEMESWTVDTDETNKKEQVVVDEEYDLS